MKLISTVLVVQTMIVCTFCQLAQTSCSIEYVYGSSSGSQRAIYVWKKENNNGMYPSSPLCLDVNYEIIERRCQDGVWYPKYVDNCYNFECPKHFLGFNQDKCFYQFAIKGVCPDLHSILARLQQETLSNATASYTPFSCPYDVRDFLSTSLTSVNKISVSFSFLKKLTLLVNSPEVLADGDDKAIGCYSSSVDLERKINRKAVSLKKLFQTAFPNATNYVVFELDIADHPMEYWCHIYELGQVRPITTNRVLAYKKKFGNEYVLRVSVRGSNGTNSIEKLCPTCRLMEVSSFATNVAEYTMHFTAAEAADDIPTQLSTLKADLETRVANFKTVEIISVKSTKYCLPQNGTWNLTPMGSMAVPLAVCLDPNGNPIGRECGGSFLYGAEWGEEKLCAEKTQLPETTQLLSNVTSRENVDFEVLAKLVSALNNFTSVDVALAAGGFERAQANSTLDFLHAISKIMGLNRRVLETSQKYYNAMDKILDRIDEVIVENPTAIKSVIEENLSVFTMKPFKDEVVGAAFYKHNRVRRILKNQTLEDLPRENLEAVVIAPRDLLEGLTRNLSREKKEDFEVIVTAFKNDDLFSGAGQGASGRIINVAIPGFRSYWFAPTQTFLRPTVPTREIDYGFWDYERGIFNTERIHSGFAHSPHYPPGGATYPSGTRSIGISNPRLITTVLFLWHFFEYPV